jgi:molybdate transport repressor ModE-like protein
MNKQPYDLMDLKALRCFEATARHGSLTKASIELGISDAAVSQRVKSLENHLGAKLYETRGGRVRLTDAGERTRDMALRLFDELADFEETIADAGAQGTIVLGAELPLLRYQLPEVYEAYIRQQGLARLRMLGRTAVEMVRRNEADLGIVHQRPLPPGLVFHPWREFNSYVLVPRGHPLARDKAPTLQDLLHKEVLERYPIITGEIEVPERNRLKTGLEKLGLPYNVGLEVGNIETVKHYVARGHGPAAVSGVCLTEEDDALFHIIEIPKMFQAETVYGVVLRKDKHLSQSLKNLLALFDLPAKGIAL